MQKYKRSMIIIFVQRKEGKREIHLGMKNIIQEQKARNNGRIYIYSNGTYTFNNSSNFFSFLAF